MINKIKILFLFLVLLFLFILYVKVEDLYDKSELIDLVLVNVYG